MPVRVQTGDFDVAREIAALRAGEPRVGAVAAFIGLVRDINDAAAVTTLTHEHYPGMTQKAPARSADEAHPRWSVDGAAAVHRVRALTPTDHILRLVATG